MLADSNQFQIIKITFRNQLVTLVTMSVLYIYDDDFARIKIGRELPNFYIVMRDVIGCWLCHEFVFYYSHRLLHTKWLYPLHKTHQEFATPTVLLAQY